MESKSPSSEELQHLARELFPHYRETDMQFNIARRDGETLHSLDIIKRDLQQRDRLLVTRSSSIQSEKLLMHTLGKMSVPKRKLVLPNITIFQLKPGTRPLMKTLEQAPYEQGYMRRLAFTTGAFLRSIHNLDHGMFGLDHNNIAVGYAPEDRADDDVIFTVAPPLMEPKEAPSTTLEDIAKAVVPQLDEFMHADFLNGLDIGIRRRNK